MSINISSKMFLNNIKLARKMEEVSTQRIATNKRVNSASDDPSAISKIQNLTASLNTSKVVQKNLQDAIGLTSTMENTYNSITSSSNDLLELAVKSENGVVSDGDKAVLKQNATQILDGMASSIQNAEYNGKRVFDNASYTFQAGLNYGDKVTVTTPKFSIVKNADNTYDITKSDGTTLSSQTVDDILKSDFINENIISQASVGKSYVGSMQNFMDKKTEYLQNMDVINSKTLSNLQDVDIAEETMNISKAQTLLSINTALQSSTMSNYQQYVGTLLNSIV